ncbi:TPA: hypothetical protein RFW81_005038 [Klebsiella pneumoniae]|nr:hypothetical protein [Klebsiella pneumoniae]
MNTGFQKLDRSPEVQKEIDDVFMLIEEGKIEEAKNKINKIELDLNGEIPELVSAKFDIELQGWDKE